MRRKAPIAIASIALSSIVAGCFSGEPPRYAATGQVTIGGAPAPFVVVRFLPVAVGSLNGGSGTTDGAGKFKIGEDGKNTGLPSGEYKVTFSQTIVDGKPTLAGSGGKAAEKAVTEKEAVEDDFRDPRKTPITASIGSGSNSFTFDIKAKK